nr:hypothetical protein MFLOJ_00070 [Mycobacterium florentinum]
MGVDAAVLTACSAVVAHDALYYGYDPLDPAEEIFMMHVIALGLAETEPAKVAAYQQLTLLTESLARNAAWQQLDRQVAVKVIQKFAVKFAQDLTLKKLVQLVPGLGVGLGAALNWTTVGEIADAAYWAYRERFLYERAPNSSPSQPISRAPRTTIDYRSISKTSSSRKASSSTANANHGDPTAPTHYRDGQANKGRAPVDHIATADAIAAAAHAGQVDKAGMPYIGHVRRVASYVDPANTDAVVAALLHDVIEDTGLTAADLAERGIPQAAIDAIELLTRRDDQPSADYYRRISAHPTAGKSSSRTWPTTPIPNGWQT